MNIPIKKRLIVLSVIAITIPLIILSMIFFVFGSNTMIRETTDRSFEKMLLLDQALTLYIEKIKHTVNTIANHPLIVGLDTKKIVTYKYNPDWTDMMPLHNSQTEQEVYEYLRLINQSNPDFGAVYIGTESGKFVMYPPSNRMPYYDPSKRPWYLEAKEKNGRLTTTSPFQSSDTNYFIFAVAKYVYFISSQEYGVVSANIDLTSITKILGHFNIGKNSFVILTKNDNTIIANTREPQTNFKKLDSDDMPDYYHKLCRLEKDWEEITTENNVYLARRMHSLGTEWFLYALIDKGEVIAPFKKVFFLMIILSILVLTVFTPIIIKFSVDSLAPLRKLSDHLFSLANGTETLQKKIPLYSSDEVGKTIENYNLLLESLNTIFSRISEAEQSISSNNASFSNQMLIVSAEISKNISSIDNIEKEIHHAETCINNSIQAAREIEKIAENKEKNNDRDYYKFASIIKLEIEQLGDYFKSLISYIHDIKKTTIDINSCVDKTTDFCRSSKNDLLSIGKILSVYKLKSPEESGDHEKSKK